MKKSKIKSISIHRIKISQEGKTEITDKLTYYHSKAMNQKLDSMHLPAKNKLKIISNK